MTRSELIQAIAERFPQLNKTDCDVAVKEIMEAIGNALADGHRVEIRGFGSFSLNYRASRTGCNPKTGQTVLIPEKHAVHFKAGKELRELVDLPQNITP